MKANVVFLLHAHMPYVRRNGDWPVGEEWLLEAWAECYLPLLEMLRRMALEGWGRLSITLTPILAEQLDDPYMQERFHQYLENKLRQCEEERVRLERMRDLERRRVNRHYFAFYHRLLELWGSRYRGRMRSVFRELSDSGRLEILASAATHAFLPMLRGGKERERQVRLGSRHHREWFGAKPRGFWLPECAWAEGMEDLAESLSKEADYVVLNFSAASMEEDTSVPRTLCGAGPRVLLRDRVLHELVWAWEGLPSHPQYREFHKRDLEGHGFQYWRISGPGVPLDEKECYRREEALERVRKDALFFVGELEKRASSLKDPGRSLLLAAYDAEIFGHWWSEGMAWLEETLRLLESHPSLNLSTAAGFLDGCGEAPLRTISPAMTSWGRNHDFSTWICPHTEAGRRELLEREKRYAEVASGTDIPSSGERAMRQALRELLLMESSDWFYMMGQGEGSGYAQERLREHCRRFDLCLKLALEGRCDGELAMLEETDNPFPPELLGAPARQA